MPEFRSAFSKRLRLTCSSGEKEFPVFEFDSDLGDVVKTDKMDPIFDKIQSYEDEVLLKNIIKRCGITGETLAASPESFGDSTRLPKSLLELKDNQNRVQGFVDSLSNEDLVLLNEKGFDEFLSFKISESVKQKVVDKVGDDNE